MIAAPAWRRLIRAPAAGWVDGEIEADGHELESEVDVHAFAPDQLRDLARGAGFDDVRLRGEELLANAYGWVLRTLEATAEPEYVPMAWRRFAFRSYLALQRRRHGGARTQAAAGALLQPRAQRPALGLSRLFRAAGTTLAACRGDRLRARVAGRPQLEDEHRRHRMESREH